MAEFNATQPGLPGVPTGPMGKSPPKLPPMGPIVPKDEPRGPGADPSIEADRSAIKTPIDPDIPRMSAGSRRRFTPYAGAAVQGTYGGEPRPIDRQLEESVRKRDDVKSGHEAYNVHEVNEWLAIASDDDRFVTGQEMAWVQGVRRAVETDPEHHKLDFGQMLDISLEMNGGDMTKALLTMHNGMRQLSRGDSPHIQVGVTQAMGKAFFRDYCDGRSLGLEEGLGGDDDWYHAMACATAAYLGKQNGLPGTVADGFRAVGNAIGRKLAGEDPHFTGFGLAATSFGAWMNGLQALKPSVLAERVDAMLRTPDLSPEERADLEAVRAATMARLAPDQVGMADHAGETVAGVAGPALKRLWDGRFGEAYSKAGSEYEAGEVAGEQAGVHIGSYLGERMP